MSVVRVAWYKNTNNVVSTLLCVITFVMAYNYWTISQDVVLLDAKVRICEQKELDFNGVATECKKRVSELHDKVSILTSDKEVITTQKNSLFELAQARQKEVEEWKTKNREMQTELESVEFEKRQLEDRQRDEEQTTHQLQEENQRLQEQVIQLQVQLTHLQETAHNAPVENTPVENAPVANAPVENAAVPVAEVRQEPGLEDNDIPQPSDNPEITEPAIAK